MAVNPSDALAKVLKDKVDMSRNALAEIVDNAMAGISVKDFFG